MNYSLKFLCFSVVILTLLHDNTFGIQVSHDGRAIKINGERKIILSGAIHYPRSTTHMWPDLIKKAKAGGLDAIETYVFWNAHEQTRRKYDFSGNLDLIRFIKTIQNEGLYVILRIGPYVCAEWNYGGFPVWLHNLPGIEFRTANEVFMNEMQNFTTFIVDMVKNEKLFASQGGPIILAQIENEYGNVMAPYGDAGKAYINWCAKMAVSLDIGIPWIMCQQADAPQPMLNTCNGFYCDKFTPNTPNTPKMWTELWLGWFKNWGGKDPHRPTEDVAYAVARFFQNGGSLVNYYMYHGGTNFGRTAGGPYITTSYDYDAPLNEYGSLSQPKYGHLKQLHDVIHSIEKTLTYGNISTIDFGNSVLATIYALDGKSSCFFGNTNSTFGKTINYQGVEYTIPAWSVSILSDCKTEVYNTAKINTQTSVMVKKSNEAENELKWLWKREVVAETVNFGLGNISANKILDQKVMNDVSDYLWYMTSVNLKEDYVWSRNMTIRVNETGHVLHAYVNGKYIGSQWGGYDDTNYVFEKKVKFKRGINQITLLSATVGLKNYGPHFDVVPTGLPGPVEIVGKKGDETIIKDLSEKKWKYKIGLKGFDRQFFQNKLDVKWQSHNLPINKMLTWYKANFKAPLGEDPIVVDLKGLGKGLAWVNGKCIGRYWPTYIVQDRICSIEPCDYRGSYDADKCVTNCGQPTQRWYHVPRSFLNKDVNELVLFEEFGGNPTPVKFQTVGVGRLCGSAYEHKHVEISCNGRNISSVKFASFGDPQGTCGSFLKGTCESKYDAISIVRKACVGKERCRISSSEKVFGSTNCGSGVEKRLLVEATIYALDGKSSCFFGNTNSTFGKTINYQGVEYTIPAWSVSILSDCKTEVYNTAKINTQTSVMVKKSNEAENGLKWLWKREVVAETDNFGLGNISANKILDQKVMNDVSDYFWYMTSVYLKKKDYVWSHNMTIRVNETGHDYVWVQANFKAPLGEDPIVVDLKGLGKGLAWVNGKCIGRYWPTYIVQDRNCSIQPCDYRGSYDADKCVTNCGQPTQRWYHVPHSFINKGVNELVLFEEFGGNPTSVKFQTVGVGVVCGSAYENKHVEISCNGKNISSVKFASFGDPQGICGSFVKGTCESKNDAVPVVRKACVGKESCRISSSEKVFGSTNCENGVEKRLWVEVKC